MNEETIIMNESNPANDPQERNEKKSSAWKYVTLGGVSGILMGAGAMYAGTVYAKEPEEPEEVNTEESPTEHSEVNNTETAEVAVANVNNGVSFSEAFAAAREAVGPDGVFYWHGGIYSTHTAEEWNAMSEEQKHEFAQHINPETPASAVSTPTDNHPEIIVAERVHVNEQPDDPDVQQVANNSAETGNETIETAIQENFEQSGDVHIVGYGEAGGHLVVGYDTDDDSQADVALIDIDDSGNISNPDILIDDQGHSATIEQVMSYPDTDAQTAAMENPDVAPDMPDYMSDADMMMEV